MGEAQKTILCVFCGQPRGVHQATIHRKLYWLHPWHIRSYEKFLEPKVTPLKVEPATVADVSW
jgi:hypothetical protein